MPEPATLPRSGLYTTSGAAVPLAGVSIHADISNLCARVAIAQRFVNVEQAPIEAVYVFPLDEAAAVCGFEAIVDGTLVVGEVKPREEAFEAYDDAMARGDGAYLLDEERPDVFQASVGNLPPGREVLLKITYVAELPVSEGRVRFAIPTTVSPRYAPADDQVGVGRPDAETLNPPVAWTVPYGLDLSVRVNVGERPARIESPSHPIAVALEGDEAVVALSQRDAALDRDFVLSIDAGSLDEPRAWIEREDDGRQAIAIAFAPSLPDIQTAADVIFVVDRSGSMDGASIAEVRNALQLCLRSLVAGCRFNIIGFGSHTQALFPGSRDYNEESLREASEHVARLQADLGGTEILPALKLALDAPPHRETPEVGDVQLRRVPIALTTGWGGLDRMPVPAAAHIHGLRNYSMAPITLAVHSLDGGESDEAAEYDQPMFSRAQPTFQGDEARVDYSRPPSRPAARRDPRRDAMVRLTSLQRADGSWELSDELLQLVGASDRASDPILKGAAGDPEEVRRAWATALALVWLEGEAGAFEDEWRLLARKAHAWLERTPAVPGRALDWLSAAARLR